MLNEFEITSTIWNTFFEIQRKIYFFFKFKTIGSWIQQRGYPIHQLINLKILQGICVLQNLKLCRATVQKFFRTCEVFFFFLVTRTCEIRQNHCSIYLVCFPGLVNFQCIFVLLKWHENHSWSHRNFWNIMNLSFFHSLQPLITT